MTTEKSPEQFNGTHPGLQFFAGAVIEQNKTIITSGPIFERVEQFLFGIFIYPLCILLVYIVVGLIGNSLVLYIFNVKWRRTKTSVFIITLAILDIINCSVNMPIEVAVLSRPLSFDLDLFCKIARCFSYITTASYSFLLVAVAFDRYLMVCRPLKRMTLGTQYAIRTCIGAVLTGVLTQWPSVIIYGTYVFNYPIAQSNMTFGKASTNVFVQGKTCLVTNYYYHEKPTLTYAFQGFLFVGHVLIFSTLTVVYIIIGKRLYISSHIDFENTVNKSKLFKKGLLSALTGSVLCGRRTTSVSTENIHPRRPRISTVSELFVPHSRLSTDSEVSCSMELEKGERKLNNGHDGTRKNYGKSSSKSMNNIYCLSTYSNDLSKLDKRSDDNKETNFSETIKEGPREDQQLTDTDTKRNSTESGNIAFSRPLIPRSVSMDGAQVLSTCIERTKKVDLKELSLKRNTLIMRMVTFTFMLSYLPFLIIVTLRYANPDIPGKLTRVPFIVYSVFLRSYFFNSVTRPFIYAVMNKEYRKCVLQLLHIRK